MIYCTCSLTASPSGVLDLTRQCHVAADDLEMLHTYFENSSIVSLPAAWLLRQEELIRKVLSGGDVMCIACTGFGKSLLYQLPGMHFHATENKFALVVSMPLATLTLKQLSHTAASCVQVSPLISLMEDQVARLNAYSRARGTGDVAAFLGSAQLDKGVEQRAIEGGYAILYVTPEKLFFLNALLLHNVRQKVALIAVDEAHCIPGAPHRRTPTTDPQPARHVIPLTHGERTWVSSCNSARPFSSSAYPFYCRMGRRVSTRVW